MVGRSLVVSGAALSILLASMSGCSSNQTAPTAAPAGVEGFVVPTSPPSTLPPPTESADKGQLDGLPPVEIPAVGPGIPSAGELRGLCPQVSANRNYESDANPIPASSVRLVYCRRATDGSPKVVSNQSRVRQAAGLVNGLDNAECSGRPVFVGNGSGEHAPPHDAGGMSLVFLDSRGRPTSVTVGIKGYSDGETKASGDGEVGCGPWQVWKQIAQIVGADDLVAMTRV